MRAEIESAVGRGERTPYEEVTLTPRAKKVLELALDDARRLGHNYIGTEHLLLGLIREGEGVAARVLEALGADLERVRSQVVYLLGEEGTASYPKPSSTTSPPGPPEWGRPMGTAKTEEPSDQTTARLTEIARRLAAVELYFEVLRTELRTGLQIPFWQFAALSLAVELIAAAGFLRHYYNSVFAAPRAPRTAPGTR